MNEDEVYLNILKDNLLFMRHQETQRMWIANVFVAVIVGFLALVGKNDLVRLPWYIYLALIIISLICLFITLKLNHVFTKTKDATEQLLNEKKIPYLGKDWQNYMVTLKSESYWKCPFLSVRWLYVMLYALSALGFLLLWILVDC